MSNSQRIEPNKITKPIQLLASWLVGLVLVNGSFLSAASAIETPSWLRATLVIASVINVPIFLVCIFLLQTKFRPEMQEDSFYHEYLLSKDGREKNKSHEVTEEPPKEKGGIWDGYSIQLNQNIKGFETIESVFKECNIPISTYFGGPKGHVPPGLTASIGRGFSDEQIKQLVKALSKTSITHIDYAADEEKADEWNNIILIGSWVSDYETHSVPIREALDIVNNWAFKADKFYSEIIIAHGSGNA
ncbi:hypothetical protein [Rheinheimera texasensis]|uniref:hypothetical protein n=1 Tax=Rheinheimera texasensis TaxID=306205 RepID=UPI0032B273D3